MTTPNDASVRIDQFHVPAERIGGLPADPLHAAAEATAVEAGGRAPAALSKGQLAMLATSASHHPEGATCRGPMVHMANALARRGLGAVSIGVSQRTRFLINDAGRAALAARGAR